MQDVALTMLANPDAEESVLAALMMYPEARDRVALTPEDFDSSAHREIYRALMSLLADQQVADPIAVVALLRQRGMLERVGGAARVMEISLAIPSASNVRHHASLVQELSALRELRVAAYTTLRQVSDQVPSVEVHAGLVKALTTVDARLALPSWVSMDVCLREAIEQIERAYKGEVGPGVSSGLKTLDGKIGGFQPGHMVVLAGRPSMGKTALALGTGLAAAKAGKVVGLFSLEMGRIEIAKRLLSMHAECLPVSALDYGHLAPEGWTALTESASALGGLPFFVADQAYLTMDMVQQMASRLQRQQGLDVLIIDYLQLLETDSRTDHNVAAWTAISRKLKVLAKELGVPVMVLSQLSRECERRLDKRPMLSDLRESGAIEQDADMVIFVYRDEVYDDNSPDRGLAELLIRKNRHGPIGEVKVRFDGKATRFLDGVREQV